MRRLQRIKAAFDDLNMIDWAVIGWTTILAIVIVIRHFVES